MKKKFLFIISIFLLTIFSFFYASKNKPSPKPDLLVTIAPYKYFIERLTDHTLKVKALVPEASDPHGFEPSAKELMNLFSAKAWFMVGEPFESQFLPIVKRNNPDMLPVSLIENIKAMKLSCCSHHDHHSTDDLHFWMSPKITQEQVQKIALVLKDLYPEKSEMIDTELKLINQDFDELNLFLTQKLKDSENRSLLVSHPAFGYFCRDYHLEQLSLENESQDTSPKELAHLFAKIKQKEISRIYVQKQYNYKMAKLTADSLNLEMVEVNPYSEQYFDNMKTFGSHLGD